MGFRTRGRFFALLGLYQPVGLWKPLYMMRWGPELLLKYWPRSRKPAFPYALRAG